MAKSLKDIFLKKNKKASEKVPDKGPLISVIMPIYNVEKYLERCIMIMDRQDASSITKSLSETPSILLNTGAVNPSFSAAS